MQTELSGLIQKYSRATQCYRNDKVNNVNVQWSHNGGGTCNQNDTPHRPSKVSCQIAANDHKPKTIKCKTCTWILASVAVICLAARCSSACFERKKMSIRIMIEISRIVTRIPVQTMNRCTNIMNEPQFWHIKQSLTVFVSMYGDDQMKELKAYIFLQV